MRIRRIGFAAVVCLLAFGFWQLGHGAYIPAKAVLAQALLERAWQLEQRGDPQATPWPWADTYPIARLRASTGQAGAGKTAIDLIVLEGASGRTLAFGPGHMSASVMPGEKGNSIIAGHRDTHFRFLQDLKAGDRLQLETVDGRHQSYTVTGVDVVDSRSGSLTLDGDAATLTLLTCYPFDARTPGGPLRYLVTALLTTTR